MIKKIVALSAIVPAIAGATVMSDHQTTSDSNQDPVGWWKTKRDNVAYLYFDDDTINMSDVNMQFRGLSISDGQPYDQPTVTRESNHHRLKVFFHAGRHKTKDVANSFNYHRNGNYTFSPGQIFASHPRELNFMLRYLLQIGNDTFAVMLGQGHTPAHNNWWITTDNDKRPDGWSYLYAMEVKSQQGTTYCIRRHQKDEVNSFDVSKGDCDQEPGTPSSP